MVAERKVLRLGIQRNGQFDFALENSGKTVQCKIDAVTLRLRTNRAG